jgi:FKBP-type peptidyl-prolyl cis-trans isomerase FkpA
MFRLIAAVLVTLLATSSFAADKSMTEDQKALYAIGLIIFSDLAPFNLTPAELEYVKQGLADAASGKKPEVELSAYSGKVQELARARRKVQAEKLADANKGYLNKAAEEKGAVKSDSGMIYISLKEGSGAVPGPGDTVKVNYRGTFPDGKEFDSSYTRGQPAELRLDGVIRCWNEGLQKMKSGGKARLICPPETAYGDTGAGDLILPGATLAFEVELLGVMK